jgi:alpha-ketoglutarate-dependent taurine dioxygenase
MAGSGGSGPIHLDLRTLLAEGVAGEGFAELGHGAEIAGVQLRHFDGLAALHDRKMRQALLAAAGVVFDRDVVLDDSADDLEEGDAPGEWVAHGFEDHHGSRLLVVDFAGGLDGIGIGSGSFSSGESGPEWARARRARVRRP